MNDSSTLSRKVPYIGNNVKIGNGIGMKIHYIGFVFCSIFFFSFFLS